MDYATTALEKDDLDLAGSLLQKTPEYQPLHGRVTAARKQRLAQHKRQRLLANTVRGLFLLVLLAAPLVTLLASWIPTLFAVQQDPSETLREA